jgi:hypothetical protein
MKHAAFVVTVAVAWMTLAPCPAMGQAAQPRLVLFEGFYRPT